MTEMNRSETFNDGDADNDIENDIVIATALRRSLIVLMILLVPVIAILIYFNVRKQLQASNEDVVVLPEKRKVDVSAIPLLTMTNVTDESGVDFTHQSGRAGERLLPETMGSGVAVFDFNDDGNQDLLFVNSCFWPWDDRRDEPSSCKLFAGDGQFRFDDVTKEVGLDVTLYGMGAAVGDYDNDGDCDVFLSAVGTNRLFRNDRGVFVDVTDEAGVSGADDAWSTSSALVDIDNDGLLDLFVCNYVDWNKQADLSQGFTLDGVNRAYGPPRAFGGTFSYLYKNRGDGKFDDVSEAAGIHVRNDNTNVPLGKALGVAPVDVNRDGWMDLVVANDTVRNFLFQNRQDGTFEEVGRLSGIAFDRATGNARGAMGIDTAFFRDDQTLAIGIGNFANEPSALYMAGPDRNQFVDAAMYTGFGTPTRQGLTFGLFFFDVDLDGRQDVLGANGHLEDQIAKTQATQRFQQSPQLFWNAGRQSASELVLAQPAVVGNDFHEPIVGRGAAYGDFDGDGDQDVVISTSHGKPVLFRNDQLTGNHYLRFRLVGSRCNRDAIGAVVSVLVDERTLSATVMPTRSYLSQCERTLTFGLGKVTEVQEVNIRWPGGETEVFVVDSIDTTITLVEGTGVAETIRP